MKMRVKRKQFWWALAAQELDLPFASFVFYRATYFKWRVARILHQMKD